MSMRWMHEGKSYLKLGLPLVLAALLPVAGCGSDSDGSGSGDAGEGGAVSGLGGRSSGGAQSQTGGADAGGAESGGSDQGGAAGSGGTPGEGGSDQGGSPGEGGSDQGGSPGAGGSEPGGAGPGGAAGEAGATTGGGGPGGGGPGGGGPGGGGPGGGGPGGGGPGGGGPGGAGAGGAGGAGGLAPFEWPEDYDENGLPEENSDGNHQAGNDCLSCHAPQEAASSMQFLFGGTVYQANGTTGAANVEVGVITDGQTYTTYTATNGNFWVEGATNTVDWTGAVVVIRNENGEARMTSQATGTCNLCHQDAVDPPGVIIEPQP